MDAEQKSAEPAASYEGVTALAVLRDIDITLAMPSQPLILAVCAFVYLV